MGRYNLRSTRTEEIRLPVELQMAGNGEFLSQALGNSHPYPGQVTFQSNSTSASDLNLSAIFRNSDSHCSPIAKNPESESFDQPGQSAGDISKRVGSDQDKIDMEILKQLTKLGHRLDNLEQNITKCKKICRQNKN